MNTQSSKSLCSSTHSGHGISNKSSTSNTNSKSEALTVKSTKNEAMKRINHINDNNSFYNFMAEISQNNTKKQEKIKEEKENLLLSNIGTNFLQVRMLNDTDYNKIKYFKPINVETTTSQILKGLGYSLSNPDLLKMRGI